MIKVPKPPKKQKKITRKIFFYSLSLIVFNFFIVSMTSDFFLEKYAINSQIKYLEDIYLNIADKEPDSQEFQEAIKSMEYDNIYIFCYDMETNTFFYPELMNGKQISQEDLPILQQAINNSTKPSISFGPSKSQMNGMLFRVTGRQLQSTVIGEYLYHQSDKYIFLQMPCQQLIDVTALVSMFLLISCGIVLLISVFPTYGFTYFISKPLKEATNVARAIKAHDFSKRCVIRTNDEISELEESINIMADSIQMYMNELEVTNAALNDDINNRKKLEKAQKDFISNASHEIKTPISIISGYAEGLKCGLATNEDEIKEYCDIIIDECDRMTNIVIELINLSKLENGSIELDYSNFNINELCELIISKFKYKCNDIGCKINIEADGVYNVRGDYNEIEKVLINYCQNAYKHVSDGGTITFIIKEESPYIYIGVNNDGNQIPDTEINKIWDKFYKVDKSHKRDENSTGLGLSIVKATMNLHKMPFGVKNTPSGVEFYIKLQKIADE